MDAQTQAALRLLAELQRANEIDTRAVPGQAPAVRITLRTPDGEYLGEALLSIRAANESANSVSVAAEYALNKPVDPAATIPAYLEAELEEYSIGLDTDYLVSLDSRDAVAAFDEITGYGEQL
ncbi:hypothetical protein ABZ802_31465 [Streptomyces sp. NPDC047737]|uniref:hypothetical protein n=1 Tax=Streptomyces sp. NPDC047737 TaxID=3155740 RepID=UPI0033C8F770